uniref:Uncharacterized protein n=1 Tax=Sphaerodactylus townsendi TaxID=933632 RepID=A0ACB8EF39_9SAUR
MCSCMCHGPQTSFETNHCHPFFHFPCTGAPSPTEAPQTSNEEAEAEEMDQGAGEGTSGETARASVAPTPTTRPAGSLEGVLQANMVLMIRDLQRRVSTLEEGHKSQQAEIRSLKQANKELEAKVERLKVLCEQLPGPQN